MVWLNAKSCLKFVLGYGILYKIVSARLVIDTTQSVNGFKISGKSAGKIFLKIL